MTAPSRDQVVEFLDGHKLKPATGQCSCGLQFEALVEPGMRTEHREHLADVLTPWLAALWPADVVRHDDYGG